jgi:tetratricopeptide (TPR) repeat protein
LAEPDNCGALYIATVVMLDSARHVSGIQLAKRITELKPKDPRGWQLLTLLYGELHKHDESLRYAEKALACRRDAQSLEKAAYAHVNAGNWDIADQLSLEAIKAATGDTSKLGVEALKDSLRHQAYIRLAKKDWRSGFEGYRLTMRTKWRKERVYGDSVEWNGEEDAVVIVTGEQGVGDEIMAASVIPDAAKHCKQFIFDCDERLASLFARSFPGVIVTGTRRSENLVLPVRPTHHKTLFGLSELFRREDADFPRTPFLKANPDYVEMFRCYFRKRVIGLAWSGGLPRTGMEQRKAGINAFLPLIRRGDAEFVSLEYKDDEAEVRQFEATHGIRVRRLPWVTQGRDLDLLAGLIAACDEVVGVATASLHMASALGVPTTIIANRGLGWVFAPDELLWYPPSTKMWRKQSGESWRDCVNRLVESRK